MFFLSYALPSSTKVSRLLKLQLSHLHSSQQDRRKRRKNVPSLWKVHMDAFCSHSVSQILVTEPQLAAGYAGKCSLYSGWSFRDQGREDNEYLRKTISISHKYLWCKYVQQVFDNYLLNVYMSGFVWLSGQPSAHGRQSHWASRLHITFPSPAQRLRSLCSIGFSPAPDTGSALLVHNAANVEVMVKELPEAFTRTRSLPGFSNPQNVCAMTAGPVVGHESSLFSTLHTKRCAKGWVWPKHNQTSIYLVIQGEGWREKRGLGEERASP